MKKEVRISKIQEAIEMIEEAMSMVDDAVAGIGIENNYLAYGKYGFDQLLGNGNPYDSSLQTLIDDMIKKNY